MAQELSDVQLLSCPEPLEEMFIHRGRRDLIAPQAGKAKFLYFNFAYETRGERLFDFFKDKRPGLLLYISIKNWSLFVISAGHLHLLGACILDTCTDQSNWSLVIHFGHLPY